MRRKRIGLITICPENEYPQRVMKGVFSQCEKYGYDVVVISPLVSICNYYQDYLRGDLNIYEIINYDLFDGFIITPIPMTENRITFLYEYLLAKFNKECKKPVVTIDLNFGDYPRIFTDDRTAFYHITKHLITKHKCKRFSILGGVDSVPLSNARIAGIKEAMEENNLSFYDTEIFPGDYWYTSGENLAARYISGELKLPDAIICLSDHMAIGLTNKLIEAGIKVPKKVKITGYEAVREAAVNNPPITSYAADQSFTGASAVNQLMKMINPDCSIIKAELAGKNNLCFGGTCGCKEDFNYTRRFLKSKQYILRHNYDHDDVWNDIDMGQLLESFMTEKLTGTKDPFECLCKIYESKYLLKPHKNFYLCLNENWFNPSEDLKHGYTKKINLAVEVESDTKIHGSENHVSFLDKKETLFDMVDMLPSLHKEYDKPQVFYFAPIHFSDKSLGYAVLQNDLENPGFLTEVYRNFLRNINNALEMTRTKYQISYLSEHDPMTGLENRRGMEHFMYDKLMHVGDKDTVFAIVADMDGLKYMNDNYGHSTGDEGIYIIGKAMKSIKTENDVAVRGGGDEFYLLGVGPYTEEQIKQKIERFKLFLKEKSQSLPSEISASVGYAIAPASEANKYEHLLDIADRLMYKEKREKKRFIR